MERRGMIHEMLDIKILLLYILRLLPEAIDINRLLELAYCDEGVGYFELMQCLSELVATGHVDLSERGYSITEKGRRNGAAIESSIPYSVRQKAERETLKLARVMLRLSMIGASHEPRRDGGVTVVLSLRDGIGEVMELRLLAPSENEALKMEDSFRARAESIYNRVIEILMEE